MRYGRWATGDGRRATGDGRRATGDGRSSSIPHRGYRRLGTIHVPSTGCSGAARALGPDGSWSLRAHPHAVAACTLGREVDAGITSTGCGSRVAGASRVVGVAASSKAGSERHGAGAPATGDGPEARTGRCAPQNAWTKLHENGGCVFEPRPCAAYRHARGRQSRQNTPLWQALPAPGHPSGHQTRPSGTRTTVAHIHSPYSRAVCWSFFADTSLRHRSHRRAGTAP